MSFNACTPAVTLYDILPCSGYCTCVI